MQPSACGLGQHFQDLGHSFSLYGPPSRQITYISPSLFRYSLLLFLPTQIRFPIGGWRVMCRGCNFTNSPGQTKLTNSPGKQQLELSIRTWSGRAPWNRGKFVSQQASSKLFFAVFSIFELGGMTKHIEGLGETKLTVFPWGQSWSVYYCFCCLSILMNFYFQVPFD